MAHAMNKVAFSQGFIRILDDLFVPLEQLRATHFAFGLCFVRVPAVRKGIEKVISIMPKTLILPRFYMGF